MTEVKQKRSKITPEIQELSGKIAEHLQLKESVITDKPEETAYGATLPDNLTMQMIADMEAHNRRFVAASTLAIGKMANEAISKDNNLNEVTAKIAFGSSNHLKTITDRTHVQKFPNQDGTTTSKEVKGNTVSWVHMAGVERSDPVMKEIRDQLRADAANKW